MNSRALSLLLAVIATIPSANGQGTAPPNNTVPAGTLVALVDLQKVFQAFPPHKAALEGIKQEVTKFDEVVKKERSEIANLAQQLTELSASSRKYKELDELIAKRTAAIKIQMQLKRKDILEREARVFWGTYSETLRHIQAFCARHGVQLVMQFDSDKIDPSNRRSILEGVNRQIVFHSGLDITNYLIEQMKR